jgi:hypothetical protein
MGKIHARNTSLRTVQLIVAVTLLSTLGWTRCQSDTPPEYRNLFYLPQEEQKERFKQFSIEKQVDIYMYAMYVEPPLTRYATYLGNNGEKVLPVLLRRLEAEKSDTAKSHLIYAFKEIHEHHYSLTNQKETIESLEKVISNMTDEYRKTECAEYLKTIKESPGFNQ